MSEALLAPVRKRVTSGIVVTLEAQETALAALEAYSRLLEARGLAHRVEVRREGPVLSARFLPAPTASYLGRLQAMECRNARELGPEELCFEIFARMLAGPVAFAFPNLGELEANVRMRLGIVAAARETELTFNTAAADRPAAGGWKGKTVSPSGRKRIWWRPWKRPPSPRNRAPATPFPATGPRNTPCSPAWRRK